MTREFIAMAAAFGFLVFCPKGKLWIGFSLLITGAILGLCAGHAPALMAENFVKIVTTPATMKTIAVVIQVGILSALMKHYGILAKLVDAFKQIFSSAKAVIMILPAAIGILSVPGGAGISSPFVDELGASMDLPVPKRAAVNLTFRHMAYFLFPTSTPIILMSNIAPQISTYRLIAMNVAFIFCMELTSYLLYLRTAPSGAVSGTRSRLHGLAGIAVYMSPIYIVIALNALLGVPMYLCLASSLLLVLIGWGRRNIGEYGRVFWKGFSFKTFVTMLGIYYIQNTVRSLTGIMTGFQTLFVSASGFSVLLVIAAAALLFGLTTGLSYVPLGVLIPLVLGLNLPPMEELIYCVYVYTWSFVSYFFSPLHLCQVLTLEQMGCEIKTLDRNYLPLMAEMAVAPFVIFYIYRAIFL